MKFMDKKIDTTIDTALDKTADKIKANLHENKTLYLAVGISFMVGVIFGKAFMQKDAVNVFVSNTNHPSGS